MSKFNLYFYCLVEGKNMNKIQVLKMLEYCGMSYNDIQARNQNEKVIFINDKDTDVQCFLIIKNYVLTIVFRGSDSEKDWKANFKYWKTTIPYGNKNSNIRVHSGFISTYKSKNVRKKIHKYVTEDVKKIVLTGHSYGAALAILCGVDLQYNFPQKDFEVVVFGCPRVGNRAFKKSYDLRIFKTLRIENPGDIVTKVPFSFLGYRHVGIKLKLKRTKKFFGIFNNHSLQEYYCNFWDST